MAKKWKEINHKSAPGRSLIMRNVREATPVPTPEPEPVVEKPTCGICGNELHYIGTWATPVCPLHSTRGVK